MLLNTADGVGVKRDTSLMASRILAGEDGVERDTIHEVRGRKRTEFA